MAAIAACFVQENHWVVLGDDTYAPLITISLIGQNSLENYLRVSRSTIFSDDLVVAGEIYIP